MIGPNVSASTADVLRAGVVAEFQRIFDIRLTIANPVAQRMFWHTTSEGREEHYPMFESVPIVKRWERDQPRPVGAFKTQVTSVENLDWAQSIRFHENDMRDDRTQHLMIRTRQLSKRWVQLDERIVIQVLTSAVDLDLLPAIPLAYDGAALTTGAARFGDANGNVLVGTGVATPDQIEGDFYNALEKMMAFQDTEGEPFFSEEDLAFENLAIVFGSHNTKIFMKTFQTQFIPYQAAGAAEVALTAQDNLLYGRGVLLWGTPRIAVGNDDWWLVVVGLDIKPMLRQERQPPREVFADETNSDEARNTKYHSVGFDSRHGVGLYEPRLVVQVDN